MSVLEGCAPTKPYVLSDLKRDPQFTMLEVLATGVVLGGVTVTGFPVIDQDRAELNAMLEEVLTKYSLYRINTPVKLSERVDAARYAGMLDYFREHRILPDTDFKELSAMYTPARYLLFVNIDSDSVQQYTDDEPGAVAYNAVRIMSAHLYIFNMDTSALTLFTGIAIRDVNTNRVQQLGGGGLGVLLGNVVAQVAMGGFPEPPSRVHALYKLFLAVADQIPSN